MQRHPRRKHVLDALTHNIAYTRRAVLEYFLNPLKESRKSKSASFVIIALSCSSPLQLKKDLFKSVNVKKFTQTPLSSPSGSGVHVHARQVVDVVVVVVIVIVVVCVDDAYNIDHCVDRDAGKGQKAERRKRRA